MKRVCWAYHRLLAVIMGDNHCVVLQIARLLDRMDRMEVHLDSVLDGITPKCTGFLRFVHVKMYIWFRAQEASEAHVPAPTFEEILDKIEEDTWIPATLPSEYLLPSRTAGGPSRPPVASSPATVWKRCGCPQRPQHQLGFHLGSDILKFPQATSSP